MARQVFSLRATRNSPHELLLPLWEGRASLSAAQVPYTAGGRKYPVKRAAAFDDAHFSQKDTRLNGVLWKVSPAQYFSSDRTKRMEGLGELLPLVQSYERAIETIHDAATTRNAPLPAMAGEAFENLRLRRNAATLSLLTDTLDMLGFLSSPAASDADADPEKMGWDIKENQAAHGLTPGEVRGVEYYSPDRRVGSVKPLNEVVGRITADAGVAARLHDSGEYILAAREMHRLLQNLYPWPATPLVFTPDQAFGSGIAQLYPRPTGWLSWLPSPQSFIDSSESDLWARTALALLHAGRVTGYAGFYDAALQCAEALTNMRYVTRGALSRAWFVFYEVLGRKHAETSQPLNSYPSLMAIDAVVAKTSYLFGHAIVQHVQAAGHVHADAGGHDDHVHTEACGHGDGHVHSEACGHGEHVHTDACGHDHVHTDACSHGDHVHTDACDHPPSFNPNEWAHENCDEEHICAEGGSEAAERIADAEGVYVSAPNGVEGEIELHGGYAVNDK